MVNSPLVGTLAVVPPAQLEADIRMRDEQAAQALQADVTMTQLAGYIRNQFDIMRRHRSSASGWNNRLIEALRAFNGEYSPEKLAEIQRFGGSDVYARIIAMKCRSASSLLRDVYLSPTRPWALDAPQDPAIPPEVEGQIKALVMAEVQQLGMMGQPIDPTAVFDRIQMLLGSARDASKRRAAQQAKVAEEKIDEMLWQGGFYKALSEFLTDLPLFPFAVIKGPVVRIVPTVEWVNGVATTNQVPRLFWQRVSPFDFWWTPGVSDIEDADTIERTYVRRAELNDLLELPGYNTDAIRAVLRDYSEGLYDHFDDTDSTRADMEKREDPHSNDSGMITCLEFNGNVQGKMLQDWGMPPEQLPEGFDELRDYMVQAWLVGRYVIKVQLSPSPRQRHPYYQTSFEKVPGTPVGNGLPDILKDIGDVCNATLRALVNNLSISSGPQVAINEDRLAAGENPEELYPWKRWRFQSDPMGNNSTQPISFFQPVSNAQELLGVYQQFVTMADELSAIPKYMSGQGASGGAGRTASGLAMLMTNASKILQTVAANIDRDVLEPLLTSLFDMLMLTDQSGLLTGQERVNVKGVNVAVQKETLRQRQLEFLQTTANPIDFNIMQPRGRAAVLRAVSETIGIDGAQVVPSEEEIATMMAQQQMMAQQAAAQGVPQEGDPAAQAQGQQTPKGGNTNGDMGPRTNTQQSRPKPPTAGP